MLSSRGSVLAGFALIGLYVVAATTPCLPALNPVHPASVASAHQSAENPHAGHGARHGSEGPHSGHASQSMPARQIHLEAPCACGCDERSTPGVASLSAHAPAGTLMAHLERIVERDRVGPALFGSEWFLAPPAPVPLLG